MRKLLSTILAISCVVLFYSCEDKEPTRFKLLSASDTGIDFNNLIRENDSLNVFQFMNIYTGAGVAVGDINNDGLTDVYFSGNMVSGKLYLNKGNMKFEDISEEAGLINNRWGTGVTMVDINQDGWLDLYVCVSGNASEPDRANMLYINNGASTDTGQVTFTEQASAYGLADTRQSMQAAFFDYDRDNDLDMYLLVNPAAYDHMVNSSLPRKLNGESVSNDRLYRNNGDGSFSDITLDAGILVEGYGLGIGISDINQDHWPDIYISNDFIGNDILYINQGDGTFKDEISEYINHTSYAGMGNDVADIDNNGRPDIMVLDMRPEDNERQKLIISSTGYDRFQMMLQTGYDPQYSRNTLQLNQGEGEFSEIGFLAGVSSTDWSWSALFADYDNDGNKDLYITNGFFRDLGNLDYIHYQNIYDNPLGDPQTKIAQKRASIEALPRADLLNYFYRNEGGASFANSTQEWGIKEKSCSNGAAYADFDNDGDLDLVVNNVSQSAFVYENQSNKLQQNNYLKIKTRGETGNLNGVGSKIKITVDGHRQYYENYTSRGYESSVDPIIHFGLGSHNTVDSLEIWWPDGSYQLKTEVSANQLLELSQEDAAEAPLPSSKSKKAQLFVDITDSLGIAFKHKEDLMVDFKLQPILPHMHSRNGPGIAVSDINGDGLEDFYIGGAFRQAGSLYFQNKSGSYDQVPLENSEAYEDMGALFFDADADGDDDLYVVSGGVLAIAANKSYQDRLYLNDGQGNFSISNALPDMSTSGSTVTATDFDKDGDLDLFIGGRVSPGAYPMPTQSYLLENRSYQNGKGVEFVDVSGKVSQWEKLSMVSSAIWSDYDNDGWSDLIVCGEFMPITIFKNEKGTLKLIPESPGLLKSEGWWNSITGGDFDSDGDIDYILGNLGLNSRFKASAEEPLCIYAKDYDKDGRVDPVMCYYYKDGQNYLAHSRDEIISQISAMRGRFKTYQSYAETVFEKSFLPEELEGAHVVKSHNFASSYMENLGGGEFKLRPLPLDCQLGPVEGIVVEDFNKDGNLDALLTGNSYATEVASGRYDALKGVVLVGDGKGNFKVPALSDTGFLNDDDGSGLALMRNKQGNISIIVANSDGPLKIFETPGGKNIQIGKEAQSAVFTFKDGRQMKFEFYYGSGYLSQSTRSLSLSPEISEISIVNFDGEAKKVYENK